MEVVAREVLQLAVEVALDGKDVRHVHVSNPGAG